MINGKSAPIVGRICMDQMMVDVTDIPDVKFENELVLLGEGYTADDMAQDAGTIGYEIVCDISKRVTKVYHWDVKKGYFRSKKHEMIVFMLDSAVVFTKISILVYSFSGCEQND